MKEDDYTKIIMNYYNFKIDEMDEEDSDEITLEDEGSFTSRRKNYQEILNLTSASKIKIKKNIINFQNYRINNFLIKVKRYAVSPIDPDNLMVDMEIYEEITSLAFNDEKGKVLQKIDVTKDDRFREQHWHVYFNRFKNGLRVPSDVLVEIIKWCQALHKMKIFI